MIMLLCDYSLKKPKAPPKIVCINVQMNKIEEKKKNLTNKQTEKDSPYHQKHP